MNIELKITLWALACAYALANSFIYSWTFWSAFDINILQFASFTDIIPSIIYTLTVPFIVVISSMLGAGIWKVIDRKMEGIIEGYLSPHIKNYDKIKAYSGILATIIFILAIGIVSNYIIKTNPTRFHSNKFEWKEFMKIMLPFIITYALVFWITKKTSFISNYKHRSLIIFCICILPITSYVWAIANSKDILRGRNTLLVKSDSQCNSSKDTHYRYISSISDKAFALSLKDGSVCIFKYNHLELISENRAHFTTAPENRWL